MTIRSPIRWVGGKQKLREKILRIAPPIGMYTCYVEVFAGGAWVLFGKQPSLVEVVNDYDTELINFYRILKKDINGLSRLILDTPFVSRDEFDRLFEQDPKRLSQLERAQRFFYLLMAGWGGEIDKARFQTSITDLGGGNRLFGAINSLRIRLQPASERLRKVIIERLDWRECIKRYDSKKTFMFLDPPYPDNNVNYTHNMPLLEEHKELANHLKRAKSMWMLTCYNKPELRSIYEHYYITSVKFASGMDGKRGRNNSEIIITNYDPKALSKHYREIVTLSRSPKIALEDEAIVIGGPQKDKNGVVDGFIKKKAILRIAGKKVTIPLKFIHISRSPLNKRLIEDRKIMQLRRRLSIEIDRKLLKKLMELEEQGNVVDAIDEAQNRISRSLEDFIKIHSPS
jgi:DNA adenine methylase